MFRPRSIFIGGGTPTLLSASNWKKLLAALDQARLTRDVCEFTVEANPETVDDELMACLASGGVNRVSIGAQSFNPDMLKALERWHDPANVAKAMDCARAAGIDNINLDLIFAIPGQTLEVLDADLDALLSLRPAHVSCYSLIYEPNTPLTAKLRLGRVSRVGEELEREMYALVMRRLDDASYEQYEISNWALKPGFGVQGSGSGKDQTRLPTADSRLPTCQHNMLYWRNANWLGVGPAAASHVDGRRWKNEPHLGRYIAGCPTPPIVDDEQLPPKRRVGEQLMLGLRLREGVGLDWLDANLAENDPRRRDIDELTALGFLETTATHLRLTYSGLFVADSVIAKLL